MKSSPVTTDYKLYVENIRGIVKRASDLTKQLLAYARKGATVKQPIDIHSLIHEVTSLLHHSIDKKISIASLLTAHNSIVNGDPTQLQNVFLNLGLNARDAMPDGGEIRFETTVTELFEQDCCISGFDVSPGMYVQISVTDNGSGIPADIIGRVFEPFFTTKETGKGTGMGLAAVYGTVRGHHGIVKIISNVGHGTTVLVQLPILKETVENKEDTAPSSIQTVSGISILLADDEAIVRETASEMLKRAGHNVIVCTNGKEALDYFRTHQTIDLVILDMVMPIMNGLETFRAMKKIRSDVCAVLSSGYTLNDSVQNILDEGVMNFLQKPFRRSELLQVIQDTLGKGYVRTDVCSHP
jgi:CheY-like chemotaxis protein